MKRDAHVVGQEVAFAAGAVLGVGLPRAHAPLLRQLVHAFEVAGLVRVDAPVQQQAVRTLQLVDDAPHRVGGLDRHRLGLARGGHEGQHHQVGVAVHEHVLDEHIGALGVALGRIHEMSLHVEDQLAFRRPGLHARERLVERRFRLKIVEAAGISMRGLKASRVLAAPQDETRNSRREMPSFLHCAEAIRAPGGWRPGWPAERHRQVFAVGGGIELDRKASAFGVDGEAFISPV